MRRADQTWWKLAVIGLLTATEASAEDRQGRPRRQIVVSIPDRKLALIADGRVVRIWRTAVGALDTPSPTGTLAIVTRVAHPAHYVPGKVTPPGPKNPLGTRWLGLSRKGYGIHGTNVPGSIGRAASHGCIRMRNGDVEELFEMVGVGDTVELHGERTAEIVRIFDGDSDGDSPHVPAVTATSGAGD